MKVHWLPKTRPGHWSGWLMLAALVLFALVQILVATGQEGGETFADNLLLSIPILLVVISGLVAFIYGLIAIFKNKERSILVFLITLIGLFILIFIIGEFTIPH